MRHYGHRIGFGVEVLGAVDAPEEAVVLAALAEELGYDLVAFPDRVEAGGADA